MARHSTRKLYLRPVLRKQRRLTDLAEGVNILITGGKEEFKGGCFSNSR